MTRNKIAVILFIQLLLTSATCTKTNVADSGDFLKFSNAFVHVANRQGATGAVLVESNLNWQLSVEPPAPDWMVLSKHEGAYTDSLVVTATRDNNTGGYKFATVIATPVNNSSVPPVRLTVVQYDSTFKGK